MRITLKITSAGDCWSFGVPSVDLAACYIKSTNGDENFNETEFRNEIRGCRAVQLNSEDRGPVCAFAALLFASVNEWLDDNDKNANGEKEKAAKRIAARYRRGASATVRIDLRNSTVCHKGRAMRTVRVCIRYTDNGIVASERFDRDCARLIADFCASYSKKFVERGDPPLLFSPETENLIEELHACRVREREEICRLSCERHAGGYCSPAKFDCPHYKKGRCISLEKEN